MHAQRATGHLVRVKDVQRAVAVIGEEVRHIHEERDRPQPDRPQRILQPNRRWPVFHPPDHATIKDRALIQRILINAHGNGARETARHRFCIACLQRAKPTCGQIARNPAHAQSIGPVRRDRNLDHRVHLGRIICRQPIDKALPHLARGQLNDAVMLIRQLHLTLRGHHAKALDAADLAHTNGRINPRHIDAGLGHHHGDALTGIGRAADDLLEPLIRLDLAHPQTVRVRVLLC